MYKRLLFLLFAIAGAVSVAGHDARADLFVFGIHAGGSATPRPGCTAASGPLAPDIAHHSVELEDGLPNGISARTPGQIQDVLSEYVKTDYAAFLTKRKGDPLSTPPPIVLYFHGGLVAAAVAWDEACDQVFDYSLNTAADAKSATHPWPVFFLWHSGYSDAFFQRFPVGYRGLRTDPHGYLQRFGIHRAQFDQRVESAASHEGVNSIETYAHLSNVGYGNNEWRQMKLSIEHGFQRAGYDQRTGGAQIFLESFMTTLQELEAAHPDIPLPRTVMIGHSMGSIYASAFIRNFELRASEKHLVGPVGQYKFDLIFMAPAITFDAFYDTLLAGHIHKLRIFTMRDCLERRDRLFMTWGAYKYPRSLLYAISGFLEQYPDYPILGMERFWERKPTDALVHKVAHLIHSTTGQHSTDYLSYSSDPVIPAAPGYQTESHKHGNFSGDCLTIASIRYIIEHGYSELATPLPSPTPCIPPAELEVPISGPMIYGTGP